MSIKTKPAKALPALIALLLLAATFLTGCVPASGGAATPGIPTEQPVAAAVQSTQSPVPSPSAEPAPVDWEHEYTLVLEQYRKFAAHVHDSDADFSILGEPWESIGPDVAISDEELGYALRDLNGDGTPELFLMTEDGSVWAIYTLSGGSYTLLGAFWTRNACYLDGSDAVYISWSNSAFESGWDVCRMAEDGSALVLAEQIAMEGVDEDGEPLDAPRYYQTGGEGGDKTIISEAQADAKIAGFPQDNKKSGLNFQPLA